MYFLSQALVAFGVVDLGGDEGEVALVEAGGAGLGVVGAGHGWCEYDLRVWLWFDARRFTS